MSQYFRPIAQTGPGRPEGALSLAGGWCWFTHVECLERGRAPEVIPASDLPEPWRSRLSAPRRRMAGLGFERPSIMGILNVTPDSFSDGGLFREPKSALAQARAMVAAGADMIDIGGESTRPGADEVAITEEIARTAPVIAALRQEIATPISIDTRKAPVAEAALEAGADMINDVAALGFDPALMTLAADTSTPVCLMHSQGAPQTMQNDPRYDDVLLEVYDYLGARVDAAVEAGIPRDRIMIDPGIGFGKTVAHNLALLARISLFHGLCLPILLGVSRKRFIGTISGAAEAGARMPGSLAVALAAVSQGVQVLRVHDVAETAQGICLYRAATTGSH
ncbi:dihydropteroate synthase [Poseidonocella sedimentorum]|uniref:Dihydropteroate synthase n=1 Tax=Poseidonocella sedimentorum TaxID=871652 RepID=A0A1I6DYM4_9RHOB|nr:dihydropteroate synthase [Poseidonocella sedimentorum]SFR10599.1 Dihydropteroate synthase [Poseidonocella sedimentorum]